MNHEKMLPQRRQLLQEEIHHLKGDAQSGNYPGMDVGRSTAAVVGRLMSFSGKKLNSLKTGSWGDDRVFNRMAASVE